ncbi:phosphodiester glycosidase family protein [Wohlfahrtiimonas larvae]|uniref:Phosphodiester glycosidase family protein n=1 Tax=Wohlfahrtiimonas larvae TaxID=1157986 RepID=A0ABP9ML32_9GAMM|nr:phosphodiester glycosidase family protein [Wohlfahrtiimonas larvae]
MHNWKRRYTTINIFISFLAIHNLSFALDIREVTYHQVDFVVAEVSQDDHLQLFWKQPNTDQAYQSFNGLTKTLAKQKKQVLFATNSGIYGRDQTPLGWHVENGERLQVLNQVTRKDAIGNFSLIPNGVFFIDQSGQHYVLETEEFLKEQNKYNIVDATQSGPMLVINGQLHPKFFSTSDSLKYRSGVCVKDHITYFSITQKPINFYYFAKFFQEKLGCDNALYLDGTLSQLYYQGKIYGAPFWNVRPYVGIWAVTEPIQ